jgi:DNA helicase-2/ATP-dependent DNA helicase PcrA
MKFIADLHIHSHFSRATSQSLDPEHLALWAQKKGIRVVGTGDFTHPGWVSELQEKMIEAEDGLYRLRPDFQKIVESQLPSACIRATRFLLTGEISCIYKKKGKTRKLIRTCFSGRSIRKIGLVCQAKFNLMMLWGQLSG